MSVFELKPEFRVGQVGTHLHRERDYQPASSAGELFADAILEEFAALMRRGGATRVLTFAEVAAVVEAAEKRAHLAAGSSVCPECGHAFNDHIGVYGCFECPCMVRRPHAVQALAGGVR